MSDQIIQYTEEMVGAGHPTKADTLNRGLLVEHNPDGTHKVSGPIIKSQTVMFQSTQDIGSNTWTAITNLAITITPAETANKLLLRAVVYLGGGSANNMQLRFCVGGSPISALLPTSPGSRIAGQASVQPQGAGQIMCAVAEALFEPASISAQALTVQARMTTGNGYVNRSGTDTDSTGYDRAISSFTVMEIKG